MGEDRFSSTEDHASRRQVPTRPRLTESPWLWACIFLCGGLVALQLTGPKFRWRQPQIERQFQARQRSGSSPSPSHGTTTQGTTSHGTTTPDYSQPGHPMITLRPLVLVTGLGLIVAWGLFWWHHLRRR